MTRQNQNRRQLLKLASYSAGAAIVGSAVAIATEAKSHTRGVTPALLRLIATARANEAAYAAHDDDMMSPALQRAKKLTDAVPHEQVIAKAGYDGNNSPHWSTSDERLVRNARYERKVRKAFHGPGSTDAREYYEALERLAVAADRRDAKCDRIKLRLGIEAKSKEAERLCRTSCDSYNAVLKFPARALADTLAKIALMEEWDDADNETTAATLIADVRALAGEA